MLTIEIKLIISGIGFTIEKDGAQVIKLVGRVYPRVCSPELTFYLRREMVFLICWLVPLTAR